MPKKLERKIEREYERKGYSPKKAKSIAFATMVKKGLWKPQKKGKH